MSYDPAFQKRIYDMLMESQYWNADAMHAFQSQQLSQLLKFARDTVPFYKERLANALTADGRVNWDRWHEIPILTRDDLLNNREAMLAPTQPPGHGDLGDHLGSGTTGKPVTSRHNSLTPLVSQTALFRAFGWHGINYGKVVCDYNGYDPEVANWPEGKDLGAWGPEWMPESAKGNILQLNHFATPEQSAEFVARKSVDYIAGWPNWIQSVALATEKLGLKTRLAALLTLGTATADDEREDCRRVFGAEMISLYASKEVYNIAHQCPSGEHFHVNSELLLLEVLDDEGKLCAPGVRGRAVVTHFHNTSQPFIRYDVGDQIIMGGKCDCGRTLPVIEKIVGRISHMFRFPDNRTVAFFLPARLMPIIAARSWQIAQVAPLRIEVRYIPDGSGNKPDFDSFTSLLRARADPRVEVSYKRIEKIPLTPSGKYIAFVCELPPETT